MTRTISGLILWCLAATAGAGAATPAPQATVRATTDEVLQRIASERQRLAEEPQHIEAIAQDLIVPHFDTPTMARLALDQHWQTLSDGARACVVTAFGRLLVQRYARILLSYDDHAIDYGPVRDAGESGAAAVTQTISRSGATPLPIDYVMHRNADSGEWQVVDLVVDGVSLVRNYRGMFQVDINQFGLAEFLRGFGGCDD